MYFVGSTKASNILGMKDFHFLISIFILLIISSCAPDNSEQTITIEKRYSLTMPTFLSKGSDLHDEASLQYQNIFKEFYVVVIDEPKAAFDQSIGEYELAGGYQGNLETYAKIVFNNLVEGLLNSYQTDIIDTNVNGTIAKLTTIEGRMEDIPIYYAFGAYEGKNTYYQIIAWTLAESKEKYKDNMQQILNSFKELEHHSKKAKGT